MKVVSLVAAACLCVPIAAGAAPPQARPRAAQAASPAPDKVGEAYAQFILGHHLDEADDADGAIAAYKRAMDLDPLAADIPGELSALYLRQNKIQEAMATAEQAIKVAPNNREANRVLGVIYAALSEGAGAGGRGNGRRAAAPPADTAENAAKAVQHLELAIEGLGTEADPNVRATLARLYVSTNEFAKAIPLLTTLVNEQSQWQDGPLLLVQAYAGAGRTKDAISWLEDRGGDDPRLLPTLADLYERERRWQDAANAYGLAVKAAPRNADLRKRYATALMSVGGRENLGKARDTLNDLATATPTDASVLYMLSQAQRRLGDGKGAAASARKVIAQNSKTPWGYYALAEALESSRDYQGVIDALAPVVADYRDRSSDSFDVGMLLPHLGFAYQELGQFDKSVATFEDALRLSPKDAANAAYLIEAQLAAKRYSAAADSARAALVDNPDDPRLIRLEAQALRQSGRADQGIALLEESAKKRADDPMAFIALAQIYSDAERGPQAVRVLQDAQAKFPADNTITFELGAVLDKQKRFADAEAAFQQLLKRDPENAAALNYLGYMLAERGERLDESVTLVKKALEIDPDNGSFLDSLGWAYFKADKLDLAETSLKRAADQLKTNSIIQEHYGEVLLKLGRVDEAIEAFNRALSGDGDSIDRAEIDKKIKTAKQKLPKK